MTERYGPGSGDEGQRPSGRGAVTERLARQDQGAHEVDLTDEETRPGSSSIFDVDERARQEDQHPTGYEPPVADTDAEPSGPRGETTVTEPGEPREEAATDITPTPVPAAEPAADVAGPPGLPEPPATTGTPAAGTQAAGTSGSLLGSLDTADIRNRFLDIQAGFVDEPRQAVEEAGRFVDDLLRQVAEALQAQRGQVAGPTGEASTEDLRLALRSYRQFVDRLLGLAS